MREKIYFFLRRIPDIDHITPVIYKTVDKKMADVEVVLLNENILLSDYRLKFLSEKGVPITYYFEKFSSSMPEKITGKLLKFLNSFFIKNGSFLKKPALYIYSNLARFYKNGHVLKEAAIKKNFNGGRFVFDYVHCRIQYVGELIRFAKKNGVKLFFLPHGVPLFTEPILSELKANGRYVNEGVVAAEPDYIAVTHSDFIGSLTRRGYQRERISVLGSARFSREWKSVLNKIVPDEIGKLPLTDKLKVVYMERGNDRYGGKKDEVYAMLDFLYSSDDISFILKLHPRSNRLYYEKSSLKNLTVVSDVDSYNLCIWADVVICLVSSIAIEVLQQKKLLVWPRYLDERKTLMSHVGVCAETGSLEELKTVLRTYAANGRKNIFYDEKKIESFLDITVNGGLSGRDVLNDYVNFILR